MHMIERLYGRYYDVQKLLVSPADQGHAGMARKRVYLILARKGLVLEVHDVQSMYSEISEFISGLVATKPRDYLVASRVDRLLDASRIAAKRGIAMKHVPLQHWVVCLVTSI